MTGWQKFDFTICPLILTLGMFIASQFRPEPYLTICGTGACVALVVMFRTRKEARR